MGGFRFVSLLGITLLIIGVATYQVGASGLNLVVNTTTDAVDANPGDGACATAAGKCTLRAAIQETNALPGADTISLPPGMYTLTLQGDGENASAYGDLDIRDDLTLTGAGAAITIIDGDFPGDGGGYDRVFDVGPTSAGITATIAGLLVKNAHVGPYDGAGIYNWANLTLNGVVVANNKSNLTGGGIFNKGTLTINNSTVQGNQASVSGGGIENDTFGILTIANSAIVGNRTTTYSAGGINNKGTETLTNVTISGNIANTVGGGIVNYSGTTNLNNVTITQNSGTGSGGVYNVSGATNLKNTIIAQNGFDCAGTLNSQDYNLIGSACTLTGNTTHNLMGVNPLLGPLQDNGGPTQTHALQVGSPAIDAGDGATCATSDQRSVTRTVCDIGAYEAADSPLLFPPEVTTVAASNGSLEDGGLYTYTVMQLLVTFSEDVADPAGETGPHDVTNPANYLLVTDGGNGQFQTSACGSVQGDDETVSIDGVTYDAGTWTATLGVNGGAALPNDSYRLLVCGSTSIQDADGNSLDGNFDSFAGGDFARTFRLDSVGQTPQNSPFTVNTTDDSYDGICSTTHCSLRDAVNAANAAPGSAVNVPTGEYTLTLPGIEEELNATGDIDIRANITISGAGAGVTVIDGNRLDRVFNVINGATATISGLTVQNGLVQAGQFYRSWRGGGISVEGGSDLILDNVIVTGNTAANQAYSAGGGIVVTGSGTTLTIQDTTISVNDTTGEGGGIYVVNGGSVTLDGVTIQRNRSVARGGGISVDISASASITNTTISGNTSTRGGGVYFQGAANVTITYSTITDNSATIDGGGVYCYSGTYSILNSILVGNFAPLQVDHAGCTVSPTQNITTFYDPLLGPLQDNGGPAQTHALMPGSLAIGRGSSPCPVTDQRGQPRSDGGCDLGAYEADYPPNVLQATLVNAPSPQIGVYFSEYMSDPMGDSDPSDVTNLANYVLFSDGADNLFQTNGCGAPQGDDSALTIDSLSYIAATRTATLNVNAGAPLPVDTYKLAVCGSLRDTAGGPLDGNGDGVGDDDYSHVLYSDAAQAGPEFTVTITEDAVDGMCGVLHCTLREAISAANAIVVNGVVNIPAGTYTLTLIGDENNNASGDLDVKTFMLIHGVGANATIIQSNGSDRVFHMLHGGVTLADLTVQNGSAFGGAGIRVDSGYDVLILRSAIRDNHSKSDGGGIYNLGSLQLINSAVSGNTTAYPLQSDSWGSGGGVYNSGTLIGANSTISGNSASKHGGGIAAEFNLSYTSLNNVTVTGNTSNSDASGLGSGGGLFNAAPISRGFNMQNSLIAQNTDLSAIAPDCGGVGTITSVDYNLIGTLAGCTLTNQTANNIVGQDPLLGPLQDNGGPTQTHALLAGSPAIDGGNDLTCIVADQRGVVRIGCDIGAFEYTTTPFNLIAPVVVQAVPNSMAPPVVRVEIEFSEPVQDPAGDSEPHDVTNPANYRLFSAGPNGLLQSLNCGPTQGDDVALAIDSVAYQGIFYKATVNFGGGASLPMGQYRLVVCGAASIQDLDGNRLDGNRDGVAGDDFVLDFVVDTSQPGPNFTVNTTADGTDGMCGQAHCTLREAIFAANSQPTGFHERPIVSIPSGTYILTVPGTNEDDGNTGDLDILRSMSLIGEHAGTTIIDGNRYDRVIDAYEYLELTNLTITGGLPEQYGDGGGIRVHWALVLSASVVANNTTDRGSGGGIYADSPTIVPEVTITDSTISNNTASDGAGGGIYVENAALTVRNSEISGNVATNGVVGGGGIHVEGGSDDRATITGATITGNSAVSGGGVDVRYNAQITITNSTISGNAATYDGGGVEATFDAQATLNNVTLIGNTVNIGQGGGLFADFSSTIHFGNSIVYGNNDDGGQAPDCNAGTDGTLNSLGYNLIGALTGCALTGDTASNLIGQNPMLGPLQDNGGPTFTHALLNGSPAIDAGDDATCAPTDQRGVPRQNCDIGAYESVSGMPAFAPTVLRIATRSSTDDYVLSEDEITSTTIVEFEVYFNKGLRNYLGHNDPHDVTNPANYLLIADGPDNMVQTAVCGPAVGDDIAVPFYAIRYDPDYYRVSLRVNNIEAPLPDDGYRLLVCGTLQDLDGNALDGNGDGIGGDDFQRNFRIVVAPIVAGVNSVADTGDGQLIEGEATGVSITQLLVAFSKDVADPAGDDNPHDATNPANYRLVANGPDNALQTTACGPLAGDDSAITINSVVYDAAVYVSTLNLNGGSVLPPGRYRLLVCGSTSIRDLNGNALDGDGDGVAGGDFILDFAVDLTPQPGPAFAVNSTSDAGDGMCGVIQCTLREAINAANDQGGTNSIHFSIPGSGPFTIQPLSVLPTITGTVVIDGTTQPGFTGAPIIELDGSLADAGANGLYINASNSTVRGLVINSFSQAGIWLIASDSVIEGNYLGTDSTGQIGRGNLLGVYVYGARNRIGGVTPTARNVISGNNSTGIMVSGSLYTVIQGNYIGTNSAGTSGLGNITGIDLLSADWTTVGGTTSGARNVISGNSTGITVQSQWNTIEGNYIGTNSAGTGAAGNTVGIRVYQANNTIGGATPTARNVISGNSIGIAITGGNSTTNVVVSGNLIGTDVTGAAPLGNTTGIFITGSPTSGDMGVTIGGTSAGAANIISGNTSHGIHFDGGWIDDVSVWGNVIGADVTGTLPFGNGGSGIWFRANYSVGTAIGGVNPGEGNLIAFNVGDGITLELNDAPLYGNTVHSNGGLGIDLAGIGGVNAGVTANDLDDGDSGPNGLQNYPILTDVTTGAGTTIEGTLNSVPNTTFTLQFFSNASCDASSYGEGQSLLGAAAITTDASGDAGFSVNVPQVVPMNHMVTATATDPGGRTSEFSACLSEVAAPSNLAGASASDTQIDLTWTDNSTSESEYRIERSPSGSESWEQIAVVVADEAAYADTGLSCLTSYDYRVRGYRSSDAKHSKYSNVASATTQVCPPPAAPSGLTATGVSFAQVDLNWTNNAPDATEVRIERSPTGAGGWAEIDTVSADQNSYQDTTGLVCSRTYYYRVRAYRSADNQFSTYSNVAAGSTKLCSPPGAAPVRNYYTTARPTLTWGRISWATGYEVEVDSTATFSTAPEFMDEVSADTLEVTTTALANGAYYWRVRARRPDGTWGAWSVVDSFVVDVP